VTYRAEVDAAARALGAMLESKDGASISRIDEYVDPTFRAQLGV
jgi:hypothetical protein